jgi:geranylgeranyl diphosphate synthase type I
VPPEDALEVATILNEVCLEVIQGQYLDLSYEGRADIGLRDYFEMVSMKTGALIGASLTLGAVLGGGEPHTVRAFKEWGRSLGRLFQIRDDVLGIWGDEDATGKPVGSDIRRRKKTLPVVFAMSRSRAARERIVGTYEQANVSEDDVAAVMEIMEGVRAREYAQGLANEQRDIAMDALSGAEISPEGLRHAEEIADFLATRSR